MNDYEHEWRQLVLSNLDDLKIQQKETDAAIKKISEDVTSLKVKAGMMGALAGSASAFLLLLAKIFGISKG